MNTKLVRDHIPEIMRAAGHHPSFSKLDPGQRLPFLIQKLTEEINELTATPCLDECADVMEVVGSIARELGHTQEELYTHIEKKKRRNGGFDLGVILHIGEEANNDRNSS